MNERDRSWTFAAKAAPPPPACPLLDRPRLDLPPGVPGAVRIAVVSGPAGSGKTTVLARWHAALRARGMDVAWLTLDPSDADPARFLRASSAVLGFAAGDAGGVAEGLVRRMEVRPLALFVDDCHHAASPELRSILDLLARYLPAGSLLALGSRGAPPLPLARLRVGGGLLEIGWDRLRFTDAEAQAWLEEAVPGLAPGTAALLAGRIDGWAAGLALATRALAAGTPADAFSGDRPEVAEYLCEQVRPCLPDGHWRFLLRTSPLDVLSGPACAALTGQADAVGTLEALERAGAFVSRDGDVWRRPALVTDFLRRRLAVEEPEAETALHLRASRWHEEAGSVPDALRHAIAGRWYDRAAELLVAEGRELFRQPDFRQLRSWIERLPQAAVRARPELCALHAWSLAYLGEFRAARAGMTAARAALAGAAGTPRRVRVDAELRVLDATLGIIQTDDPVADGLDPSILGSFGEDDPVLHAFAEVMLGYAARGAGDLERAAALCRRPAGRAARVGASLVFQLARFNQATIERLAGRSDAAEAVVGDALAVSRERGWLDATGCGFLRVAAAVLHLDGLRPADALVELDAAVAVLEATQAYGFLGVALVERARALHALGREQEADAVLADARRLADRHDVVRVGFRADLAAMRFASDRGVFAPGPVPGPAAAGRAAGTPARDDGVFPERHEAWLVERLRLMLAGGQHAELLRLSVPALRSAGAAGRVRHAVEFLVLQAAAWRELGDPERAVRKLGHALRLGSGDPVPRAFVTAGDGIEPLLGLLAGDGELGGRARRLQARLAARDGGAGAEPAAGLHHREVQILRLVSEGLRNREIGERLQVSEETVKWYLKRLYTKLEVETRTSAVARGRELGVIS
ncbi:LuxR C-terminal-related transcriptional regulator [Arenibaculum sp.]|uniref:LuxR C-terminal-related transcriptional regulator n=1 Tax=Arenibaculum sp. TaxID=2865862 RepID=UPI002E12F498